MSEIVCLGWGSLIWDLRGLPVNKLREGQPVPSWVLSPVGDDVGDWQHDGPPVRVEFVRQSGPMGDRLTLVLYDAAEPLCSLWARMTVPTLDQAGRELAKREYRGIREERIHQWSRKNIGQWSRGDPSPAKIPDLGVWACQRGIQHVIWTALGPKFQGQPNAPTEDEAVAFLKKLSDDGKAAKAETYVRRAPPQIKTSYRRRIERCLNWTVAA